MENEAKPGWLLRIGGALALANRGWIVVMIWEGDSYLDGQS